MSPKPWICGCCQKPTLEIHGQCLMHWCPTCYVRLGGSAGVISISNEVRALEDAARGELFRKIIAKRGLTP